MEIDDVKVVAAVEPLALDPDQQRAATAVVYSVHHAIFITAYRAFFQHQYLTWS